MTTKTVSDIVRLGPVIPVLAFESAEQGASVFGKLVGEAGAADGEHGHAGHRTSRDTHSHQHGDPHPSTARDGAALQKQGV